MCMCSSEFKFDIMIDNNLRAYLISITCCRKARNVKALVKDAEKLKHFSLPDGVEEKKSNP